MTCCGRERTTRFCPECGKRVDANAELADLLAQCRKNQEHYGKRGHARSAIQAAKWKARADALAATMDKLAETQP